MCLFSRHKRLRDTERLNNRMSVQLTPHFRNVQAHYDLSDDFFRLFLDPTLT